MEKNIIFIPARTGSTRLRNKNIQKIGNETLLSRKIKICLKANIGDVIISTNSVKIKNYVEKLGAKCLFLRPKIYSTSTASTISAILHYLRYLKSLPLRVNQRSNLLMIDLAMIEDMLLIVIRLLKN